MPVQTFAASGGKSENAEISHFSAVGIGMAVGTATGGGIEVHHGFLAGAQVFSDSDVEPPEFDPQPQNLRFAVRDSDCLFEVVFPEYKAVDDRDQNPRVTVTIVEPLTDVNPDGETVLLPPGSYDVVLVASDRKGTKNVHPFGWMLSTKHRRSSTPFQTPRQLWQTQSRQARRVVHRCPSISDVLTLVIQTRWHWMFSPSSYLGKPMLR